MTWQIINLQTEAIKLQLNGMDNTDCSIHFWTIWINILFKTEYMRRTQWACYVKGQKFGKTKIVQDDKNADVIVCIYGNWM